MVYVSKNPNNQSSYNYSYFTEEELKNSIELMIDRPLICCTCNKRKIVDINYPMPELNEVNGEVKDDALEKEREIQKKKPISYWSFNST